MPIWYKHGRVLYTRAQLDLFEQGALDRTPIRDIVGEDPVAFVEDFVSNYPAGQWRRKERDRLNAAIERAAEAP